MPEETTYTTASGRVYLVTCGINREGKTWATYERKPSGSLRRVVSKWLPQRWTHDDALQDFDHWIKSSCIERPPPDATSCSRCTRHSWATRARSSPRPIVRSRNK